MRISHRKRASKPFRLSKPLTLLLAAIIAVAALAGAIPYWMDDSESEDGPSVETTSGQTP